jgi:hypothetical protein
MPQTRRILADKRGQRLLEAAGRDPLQVEDQNQRLQALRAPHVGRQDGRVEPDALARSRATAGRCTRGAFLKGVSRTKLKTVIRSRQGRRVIARTSS